jgi:hypothetical protein
MTHHFPEYFPGSRHQIPRAQQGNTSNNPYVHEANWDDHPRIYKVGGEDVEFFTVGALAMALNRRAPTIRRWESEGIIPKASFNKPGVDGDQRGRRRLYTRAQVEGMVKIAEEEGILHNTYAAIAPTKFTERVIQLFRELSS